MHTWHADADTRSVQFAKQLAANSETISSLVFQDVPEDDAVRVAFDNACQMASE